MAISEQDVWNKLRECNDPELPCNIVDLGLVYGVCVEPAAPQHVNVTMTLTSRDCPMSGQIATQVQEKLRELPGITEAKVELVFDPPWNLSRVTPEARQRLDLT